MTTIGSTFLTFLLLFIVWKTIQTEKVRNAAGTAVVIFLFTMLFLNRNDAIDLTISETKNWWPVFSDVVENTSSSLRDLIRTFQKGGS